MDSDEVRREWADRSGAYSPDFYAYRGPDATSEWVRERLLEHVDRDARVLELGCSAGRHLAHLHADGFESLSGIEVNPDAVDVMADEYPETADAATIHVDAVEDVIESIPDDAVDAVYSVEALQHVHPDAAWVFDEITRITAGVICTVENEGQADYSEGAPGEVTRVDGEIPLFFRDWGAVFRERGCTELREPETVNDRDTARVFGV